MVLHHITFLSNLKHLLDVLNTHNRSPIEMNMDLLNVTAQCLNKKWYWVYLE